MPVQIYSDKPMRVIKTHLVDGRQQKPERSYPEVVGIEEVVPVTRRAYLPAYIMMTDPEITRRKDAIKRRLVVELAEDLINSGLVVFQEHMHVNADQYEIRATTYAVDYGQRRRYGADHPVGARAPRR